MIGAAAQQQQLFRSDFLAHPRHVVCGIMAGALQPPPPVDLNAWAIQHVIVGGDSPFPGRYDPDRCPPFRDILAALGPDTMARIITLLGSAQIGKTFLAQVFVGGSLDLDPGHVLYVHPTEHNGIRFSRTKWRPFLRQTPRMAEILQLDTSAKEGGNSTLYQERTDGRGSLTIGGASSEASLSMVTVKRQVQDDLAKWEKNTAGDPEAQADSRSKAFDDAKIFKLGTPLLQQSCRITRSFLAGTQNYYYVPCPHCGHEQRLDPDNFIATIDPAAPELAHFTCVQCEGQILETDRGAIVRQGHWIAHNPTAIDESFTLWAAYAPFERWERIARGYLAAQGDPATEQTWWNDTGGRAYELPGESPPWEELRDRAAASERQLGQVPTGALLLTLSLDCQDDYVDGAIYGWGQGLLRWLVARVRVEGHIREPETRATLNRLVDFEWPSATGTKRKIDLSGIDAGAWTDDVLEWAQNYPKTRVIMLRGVGGDGAPSLTIVRRERRRDGRLVKYHGRFFNVGVNALKGGLYKFLRVEPGRVGYVDFPAGLDDDFFQQLTAEKRMAVIDRKGFTVFHWVKARGQRNEQLDLAVYAEALARRLGWRIMNARHWGRLAAQREIADGTSDDHAEGEFWSQEPGPTPATEEQPEPPEPAPPPPVPTPVASRPAIRRVIRSNFMNRRFR